jgi:hypothetical protein
MSFHFLEESQHVSARKYGGDNGTGLDALRAQCIDERANLVG